MIREETIEHGPPRVQITYYGDDEPSVLVQSPPGLQVTVELIDGEEARWVFLEHNGVTVYTTYPERSGEEFTSDTFYATQRRVSDESDTAFEIYDLPEIPVPEQGKYEELFPVGLALETHKQPFHEDQADRKRRMAYAIDQQWLTEDGLDVPCKHLTGYWINKKDGNFRCLDCQCQFHIGHNLPADHPTAGIEERQ